MELKILHKNKEDMSFLVEDAPVSLVSALRRIMISEVKTMAIDIVEFKKNGSSLNDDIIASRLGQIPLTFDEKSYNLPEECKCDGKGCSNCQVELILKKKGPGIVYSGDIKTTDKDVKPVFDNIPITEMFNTGEEIEFTAVAKLGIGKKHAKWQGAVVGYRNKAEITVDKDLHGKKEHVDSCPVNVFDLKGDKVAVNRPLNCILCMKCVDVSDGKIQVKPVHESFIFNVESASSLESHEIVKDALDVIDGKLDGFSKSLNKV